MYILYVFFLGWVYILCTMHTSYYTNVHVTIIPLNWSCGGRILTMVRKRLLFVFAVASNNTIKQFYIKNNQNNYSGAWIRFRNFYRHYIVLSESFVIVYYFLVTINYLTISEKINLLVEYIVWQILTPF
jgi:hypothetical protein